jgi:hypothetical protein
MPVTRDAYRVAAVRDKIYVLGNLGRTSEALEYDPASDRWSVRAAMPTHRYDFGVHASDRLIYTFGRKQCFRGVLERGKLRQPRRSERPNLYPPVLRLLISSQLACCIPARARPLARPPVQARCPGAISAL